MPLRPTHFGARNYKSLFIVELPLKGLTILIGRNGAGKSNVVDALRFVSDALKINLDYAIRERGGVEEVRRRASRRPNNFRLELKLEDPETNKRARYAFEIAPVSGGGYEVIREEAEVVNEVEKQNYTYTIQRGTLTATRNFSARPSTQELFLRSVTAEPGFDELFLALTNIATYNPNPAIIRELQDPDPSPLLRRDGRNLPSVLVRFSEEQKERVKEFLEALVPGIKGVERKALGPKETLEFRQEWDNKNNWRFHAYSMSDGTLRLLALLVAIFQKGPSLVAVEEPEMALHPAATRGFTDALLEAAHEKPILITTHSSDLLDHWELNSDQVFIARMLQGKTVINRPGLWAKEMIEEELYTLGELYRADQLTSDEENLRSRLEKPKSTTSL